MDDCIDTLWPLSVQQQHGYESESVHSELTVIAVPAKALKLVLGGEHAGATMLTRPAVTRTDVDTLSDVPALCERVGQIDLLPIDRHLKTREVQEKLMATRVEFLDRRHCLNC